MRKHNPVFVSVIIPVYNDAERLGLCVSALDRQTYPKSAYEIVIVDNGSDASLKPMLAGYAQVRCGFEACPGSYCARNTGISLARGDMLAFTDSDCIPAEDWIETGVARLLSTPNCGMIGGKIELFCRDPNHPTAAELYEQSIEVYLDQRVFVQEKQFAATANLFTTKAIFEQVGMFDDALKSGGDKQWGQRVVSAGYQVVYADEVCVAHPARHSFEELFAKERRLAGALNKPRQRSQKSLTLNYESIMAYLPPLPPIFKAMRLKQIPLQTKFELILLWGLIRYVRMEESFRLRLLKKSAAR